MKIPKLLLVAVFGCLLWAQTPSLDTPAGHQFFRWLEVFNRGDRAALLGYLEQNFPSRAKEIDEVLAFRDMTGGFEFKKAEESTQTTLTGMVKERDSDQYARFVLEVEPAEPHRIAKLDLRVVPRPAGFPPAPRLSQSEALAALRAEIENQAGRDRFAGAVLVAKGGQPVFAEAYGIEDREKKTPNQLSTKFRLGSMNKMFTAVAVAQLAQAGKLKFTDPLGKYLTDYPNPDVASKVTIHHLLTHTGGTGDIFGPQFDANRGKLRDLKDYVALYGKRGLEFEPGSRWAYSNYGFLLLGVLIEKVSGQSYYDYVREHIFKPAGMTSTDSLPEGVQVPNRSLGYTRMGGGALRPNNDTLPVRGTSAGGGYSTVEDLLRFANALLGHKLLNAQYTQIVTTGKKATPPGNAQYAYGFEDATTDGVRSIGHGGGAPGMNGDLKIYPDSGYVVAVLSNIDPPAAGRIADFIGARLPVR
ncbi:MAG: beta-lactamase family protein [Acidobacteria bacterium]|nr:beta-lactamase family protein [Acidobacteriota bacterium]